MKTIFILLTIVLWPIELIVNNHINELFPIFMCILIFLICWIMYLRGNKKYIFILLLLPIININLIFFPVVYGLYNLITNKNKTDIIFLGVAILITLILFKSFYSKSVFIFNELDIYILNTKRGLTGLNLFSKFLYNKFTLGLDKFFRNFFSIVDLNNYFFSFHPRESVIVNLNLTKFSFVTIPYFLVGLSNIKKLREYKLYIAFFVSLIVSLSFLQIFDINDFILWPLISVICLIGFEIIDKKYQYLSKVMFLFYMVFTFWELLKIFVV